MTVGVSGQMLRPLNDFYNVLTTVKVEQLLGCMNNCEGFRTTVKAFNDC